MNPAETPLVLLPGLHGSVRLFDEWVGLLRKRFPRRKFLPLALPTEGPQDYAALSDFFVEKLEKLGPFALLAESFSAPLALHLAASPRLGVARLILAGAFCHSPRCAAFRLLPLRSIFALRPPDQAIRRFLVGKNAYKPLVEAVRTEIQSIPADVLARRVRTVLALKEEDLPPAPPIPVLLLQATRDALMLHKTQAALEAHLPEARIERIDAPHMLLQVAPEPCAEAIAKLLG